MFETLGAALSAGLADVRSYFLDLFLGALLPSYFLAGAIKVFVRERSITRWLGHDTPRLISYPVATFAGLLFSVCACGILPLFASVYRHGAGLGPAIVFLTAGPAVNILAILLTGLWFSKQLAIARLVTAIVFALGVGALFDYFFGKAHAAETRAMHRAAVAPDPDPEPEPRPELADGAKPTTADPMLAPDYDYLSDEELDEEYLPKPTFDVVFLFSVMLAYMFSAVYLDYQYKNPWYVLYDAGVTLAILIPFLAMRFTREEIRDWMQRSWHFFVKISVPLLIGLFVLGLIRGLAATNGATALGLIRTHLGGAGLLANVYASLIGAPLYFGTCQSVIYVKFLMDYGMGTGPALALFLSGPAISIPTFFPIASVMGYRFTFIYTLFVILVALCAGYFLGPRLV